MRSHTNSLLVVLILSPLVGLALGWGAWWYAEMMTRERINATASMHRVEASGATPGISHQAVTTSARTLFRAYCANCHGETGDGKGTQVLDRPARSFRDGGFSFGNTRNAIFRTISSGIGGTPMPGFTDSLSVEDRLALADHVITLGPPAMDISTEDMELEVLGTPLVVRGHLPSLGEGLPEHPRGLLIGSTDGMTTEYRADDVRLLAVRQGRFVERTDWTGRGGTPLKPLGPVIDMIDGGNPEPGFEHGHPLESRLVRTSVGDGRASVTYMLDPGGLEVLVEEWTEAFTHPVGPGYARHFQFSNLDKERKPTFRLPGSGRTVLDRIEGPTRFWIVRQGVDDRIKIHGIDMKSARVIEDDGDIIRLQVLDGRATAFSIVTLLPAAWNETLRAQLREGGEP